MSFSGLHTHHASSCPYNLSVAQRLAHAHVSCSSAIYQSSTPCILVHAFIYWAHVAFFHHSSPLRRSMRCRFHNGSFQNGNRISGCVIHLWCDRTKTQFINVYSNSSNSGMAVIYALNLVVAAPRLRDFLPFGWRRTPPVFRSRALVAASRLTLHTLVAAPRLHNGLPFWSRHTQPNSNIAIILRHSLTCWWRPPAFIMASHAGGGLPP